MAWTFGLLALFVSTGAGFVWGYERHVRSYTLHVRDRIVRLSYAGAVCLSFYAGPLYLVYSHYFISMDNEPLQLPIWIWPGLIGAVVLPWFAGMIFGRFFSKLPRQVSITSVPTGYAYVLDLLRTHQTVFLIKLKSRTLIIGCPERASATPNQLDMYVCPLFFQGLEDDLEDVA